MNRPARGLGGYRSPIEGYYHAGAGSHPGGGVSGWPGRLAAETALGRHSGFKIDGVRDRVSRRRLARHSRG